MTTLKEIITYYQENESAFPDHWMGDEIKQHIESRFTADKEVVDEAVRIIKSK